MKRFVKKKLNLQSQIAILIGIVAAVLFSTVLGFNLISQANNNAFADDENENSYAEENSDGFFDEATNNEASEDASNLDEFYEDSNNGGELANESNQMTYYKLIYNFFSTNGESFETGDVGGKQLLAEIGDYYTYGFVADGDSTWGSKYKCVKFGPSKAEDPWDIAPWSIEPSFEKNGKSYKFLGWRYVYNTPPSTPTVENTNPMPEKNVKFQLGSNTSIYIYGVYEPDEIDVTFDANGGDWSGELTQTIAQQEGSNWKLPAANPNRTGYNFAGYFDAATGGNPITAQTLFSSSVTTVYAHWTAAQYTVTFDKQSGTGGTDSVQATFNENLPTVTPPTFVGYTFMGYYDAATGGVQYIDANGAGVKAWDKTSNTTLYAQWTPKTYSIKLVDTTGTGGQQTLGNVTFGQALPTLTTLPTSPDYKLNGYFTSATGGTKYINSDGTSAHIWDIDQSDPTLYAQWTPLGDIQCTITDYSGTYDAASHSISVNITEPSDPSVCTIEYSTDGTSWSATNPTFTDAGTYTVSVKINAENYKEKIVSGTVAISQKAATVTADSAEKEFGDDDPELTATVGGVIDDYSLIYNVERENGEEVGEYQITPTGETSQGNYTVNFVNNVFTITQPEIVVNPDGSITVNNGTVAFSTEQEESDLNVRATQSTLELYTILSNGSIPEEDLLKVAQGGSLEIILTITKADLTVEEKAKFEAVTEGIVDCYTDISVSTQLTTAEGEQPPVVIYTTSSPLQIEVDVPESMRQVPGTTYEVLRQHDDDINVLENTFDAEKNIITFESDKFSNYAIAYTEPAPEPVNPDNPGTNSEIGDGTAQTGDSSFAVIAELGALAAAAVSVLAIRKRKFN